MLGGGLLLLCLVIAVVESMFDDPPAPRGTLGEPEYEIILGSETVTLRTLIRRNPTDPVPDVPEPRPLDDTRREDLRRLLLEEIGFDSELHRYAGPWFELGFEHEGEALRVLISQALDLALVEGPLLSYHYRLEGGDQLRSSLEESR